MVIFFAASKADWGMDFFLMSAIFQNISALNVSEWEYLTSTWKKTRSKNAILYHASFNITT